MSAYFRCVCQVCGWASSPMLETAALLILCPQCGAAENLRLEAWLPMSEEPERNFGKDATKAQAAARGLRFVDLTKIRPDPTAVRSIPEQIARRYSVLPIKRDNSVTPNRLMVAISDVKTGAVGLDDVKRFSRCKVQCVLASKADLEAAIDRAYTTGR